VTILVLLLLIVVVVQFSRGFPFLHCCYSSPQLTNRTFFVGYNNR
jgi:hypothetical protein